MRGKNAREADEAAGRLPQAGRSRARGGTYFIGYARSPMVIEQMLTNMFTGLPEGNYDRLLDVSTAVTGNLSFVPSADLLESLGDDEPAAPDTGDAPPPSGPSGGSGSLNIGSLRGDTRMNNLHRELAPVSDGAWAQIEEEAARTFKRYLAGRRVVDVHGPAGEAFSAVGTGRVRDIDSPGEGVLARQRQVVALVELRAPFRLDRQEIDDVDRGAQDSDWQPVKDAARQIAFAEDQAIFEGYPAAGIGGIRAGATNPPVSLPADVREYPEAIAQALGRLRLAGVDGPYSVVLSSDAYTEVSETTDHGYPVIDHIGRQLSGEIIWAPAMTGAILLTTRGGDFSLQLGQDASIGYLSHTGSAVELYLQETLTFAMLTGEAAVSMTPAR